MFNLQFNYNIFTSYSTYIYTYLWGCTLNCPNRVEKDVKEEVRVKELRRGRF